MTKIVETDKVGTWWHYGFSPDFVLTVRTLAQMRRQQILKQSRGGGSSTRRRRAALEVSRKLIRDVKRRRVRGVDRSVLMTRPAPSYLAKGFMENRDAAWRPLLGRKAKPVPTAIELTNFSFLHDPSNTIAAFRQICEAEASELDVRLNFNDSQCMDVGAFLVLASLKQDLMNVFKGRRLEPDSRKVLEAVGLRAALGMDARASRSDRDIWAFPIQARRPAGTSTSVTRHLDVQKFEHVATALGLAIDKWLEVAAQQRLNRAGASQVQKIVGEVLDNAERHSDELGDGDWSMTGYMSRDGEDYRCSLAFLSVGRTVSESLQSAHADVLAGLEQYATLHEGTYFSREQLSVLYALQDGVTRDPVAFAERRGGTGLLDVVDLFADLSGVHEHASDAAIAVVSGQTCIVLDHDYLKDRDLSASSGLRRIWLNSSNEKEFAPDARKVLRLPYKLNGTLVTMGFKLDRLYLESSLEQR